MADESRTIQLVVFSLHGEEYAMPIFTIHEILRFTEPRTIASSDPCVRGIISLRGRIVPVLDLATRLGMPRPESTENAKVVIVETGDEVAGVVVDDVVEVLTIESDQVDLPPNGVGSGCIEGIAKIGSRLVVLLDAASTVDGACQPTAKPETSSAEEVAAIGSPQLPVAV